MSTVKPSSSSQSPKYETAVNRATGKDAADESAAPLATLKDVKSMLIRPSQEQIDALMADDTMEFAPQVHTLEEGDMVQGILEGRGPGTTFTVAAKDSPSGVETTRPVDTWIIRHPKSGLRLSILSSVQLDQKLPPFLPTPGGAESMITIYRGKERKTLKGFKVTDYTVCGPKKADGKLRSFVKPIVINVAANAIDGHVDQPQLPAGSAPEHGGEDASA